MVKPRTKARKLLTRFKIGRRVYELVNLFKEGEEHIIGGEIDHMCISGDELVKRAKELGADLGEEDGNFILEHQSEIPKEFRGKFWLMFTNWYHPRGRRCVSCIKWNRDRWRRRGFVLAQQWFYAIPIYLVRRVK